MHRDRSIHIEIAWVRQNTVIGTACLACDFHAETPSGFFRQFVRENKTILSFLKLSLSVILIDILSNCFIKSINFGGSDSFW